MERSHDEDARRSSNETFRDVPRSGGSAMRVMTSQRATATRPAAPLPAAPAADVRDRLVMVKHLLLVKTLAQRLAQRLPSQVELYNLVSVGVPG